MVLPDSCRRDLVPVMGCRVDAYSRLSPHASGG